METPVLLYKNGVKGGQNYIGVFSWCKTCYETMVSYALTRLYKNLKISFMTTKKKIRNIKEIHLNAYTLTCWL